jgi:hypothetical protein
VRKEGQVKYPEEFFRGTVYFGSKLNPLLFRNISKFEHIFEGSVGTLSCEKRCEISRVRRYHDQSEEPPHSGDHSGRNRARIGRVVEILKILVTHIGAISEPCCMRLPVMNQKQFLRLSWLTKYSGSSMQGYGLCHSLGEMRPKRKRAMETPKNAAARSFQTPTAKGSAKEKKLGGAFLGFWYKILIPRLIKVVVKSTAASRSEVMVKSVMARSAFWKVWLL